MNILTASTLDFIEHLRKVTRGWRIDPMVQAVEGKVVHNDYVPITPPPTGQSYTHFFASHHTSAEYSLIRVKVPKRNLRIIQCRLGEDKRARSILTLSYWRANGFRQDQVSVPGAGRFKSKHPKFNYDEVVVYQTYLIERMTKGTKNRGQKRPGKPSLIHRDRIDVAIPDSAPRVALIAKATIEKSFERTNRVPADDMRSYYSRMAVIIDGRNFCYDDDGMIVARVVYE